VNLKTGIIFQINQPTRYNSFSSFLFWRLFTAVNKRQDNKLEKLLHIVGDLFEFYDDARTYKLKKRDNIIFVDSSVFPHRNDGLLVNVTFKQSSVGAFLPKTRNVCVSAF